MTEGLIVIDKERCKGCGLCVDACPHHLIKLGDLFNSQGYRPAVFESSEKCKGCALCALMCPDIAIEVYKGRKDGKENTNERE